VQGADRPLEGSTTYKAADKGVIQVRWNECSSRPCPDSRLVKLGELRAYLPSDTPTVSAAERDACLRRRRLGAQMRNRW